MKILVVVATKMELEAIEKKLNSIDTEHNIFFLVTGVGMIATTYNLTKALKSTNYHLIINVGIAGAINHDLMLGEVVQVVEDQFFEQFVENGDEILSYEQAGLREPNEIPYEDGKLSNKFQFIHQAFNSDQDLRQVSSITVNTVHGNINSIEKIKSRMNIDVESMEGAAFFYVCHLEDMACIQLRAISNYVEKRSKSNWKINLALNNLSNETANFILRLV